MMYQTMLPNFEPGVWCRIKLKQRMSKFVLLVKNLEWLKGKQPR